MLIRLRAWEERLAQRAQVKARAADEKSICAARFNLFNLPRRIARPLACGVVPLRRRKINQVMRDAAPLIHRHFRRRNPDALIDLHGIAIDNLAAEAQRKLNPERALARCGWSNHGDNRILSRQLRSQAREKCRRKMMNRPMSASKASAPMI